MSCKISKIFLCIKIQLFIYFALIKTDNSSVDSLSVALAIITRGLKGQPFSDLLALQHKKLEFAVGCVGWVSYCM
jgi:hypothetical protein